MLAASSIAGFDLHRPLGTGGMGQVWLGSKASVDGIRKQVAIKLVPSVAVSDKARRRFLDEARLSVLLRHSNIVQVFDVGIEGDVGYIVMEWVDGIDLHFAAAAQAARGTWPWPHHVVGFVVGELLKALDYAHKLQHSQRPLGLTHRDISPHNVLVSLNGEVKLADFGIARSQLARASEMNMAGKWRYMAPEQVRGEPCRPSTDLFAVGVVLHELLDGKPFRSTRSDTQRRNAPGLCRPVPEPLDRLRHWLLAYDADWRPTDARKALELLRSWDGYRESSFELAQLCTQLRPAAPSPTTFNATNSTADGTATEAATNLGGATAPTRTSLASNKTRRRKHRSKVAVSALAAALALAASGVGVWKWSQTEEYFRGGCPFDANLDGDIDIIGVVSSTREMGSNLDLVILDGRDGHEIRRIPDRGDIEGFACAGPNVAALVLADGSEIWTGADLDHPYSAGSVETRSGDGIVAVDPKLLDARWVPPVAVDPANLWPGMSAGPSLQLSFEDASITAAFHNADSLAIESSGAATWHRFLPLETRQFGLAAIPDTVVATTSIQQRGEQLTATLVGLDPATGGIRFEVELGEHRSGSFLIAAGGLLITDFGARLVALDATTGELRWAVGDP